MLLHLSVDNYAIAEHLDIEFAAGMSAITGETGAGKSIMLDALGLVLGDRADAGVVRPGAGRADIHATFDLSRLPEAAAWLAERELAAGDECLLRRTVSAEGRSRGYINGQPATLQDLKHLGELLVDIHSQHAHQSLLKRSHQRALLDAFAGAEELAAEVRGEATRWQQIRQRLDTLEEHSDAANARSQLLRYQIQELEEVGLAAGELEALEQEQKQLAAGEENLQATQTALALCREGELNVSSILHQALKSLETIEAKSKPLSEAEQMLGSALIQVEEASGELQRHLDQFDLDPERLAQLQQRLSDIYTVARKHRVAPEQLPALEQELREELTGIEGSDEQIEALRHDLTAAETRYRELASELSGQRAKAARKLMRQVEKQLGTLAMANCRFAVQLNSTGEKQPLPGGAETVEYLISTNPGQTPQPLNKIASGGELSRISLAIQVVTARTSAVPTVIFDEVDVGIGGAVAEVVGNLLRQLGERSQVICVTHQAQVASKAQQHLRVEKITDKHSARARLSQLDEQQKVEEIARMLGGIAITQRSREHAEEMLHS